jgi:predicted nuclease of restriction endonuclease-like (RecB) superfamily
MGMAESPGPGSHEQLVQELRALIDTVRSRVAQAVNSEIVWLYWQIGVRLSREVLGGERATYGENLVSAVSESLTADYGRGFGMRNLYHMIRFAEAFPDPEIVHAVRTQLGWTHLRELIAIHDPLARQFYTELCRIERWSTRTLKAKIQGLLFERTAIARRPPEVVEQALDVLRDEQRMTPDLVFRDPYVLDFLGLPTDFSEGELEAAILREFEAFLLELGQGFSLIARQKRMSIGPDELVAIDEEEPRSTGGLRMNALWRARCSMGRRRRSAELFPPEVPA